jgi:hypothetical protein
MRACVQLAGSYSKCGLAIGSDVSLVTVGVVSISCTSGAALTLGGGASGRRLATGAPAVFSNLRFIASGGATQDGGAVVVQSGRYVLEDVEFQRCRGARGGALFVSGATTAVTLTRAVFVSNTGSEGGAIHVTDGALLVLDGVIFTENSAVFGGAMYVASGAVVTAAATTAFGPGGRGTSTFVQNRAVNGGDIATDGAGVALHNLTLGRASASALGGSLFVRSGDLLLSNTSISGSSADRGGCFAISDRAVAKFAGVQLAACVASAAGGGLFVGTGGTIAPSASLSHNSGMAIIGCNASTGGGAALASGARAVGLVIRGCTAEHGGGVGLTGAQVILSSAVVSSCTARVTGGCLHAYSAESAVVDGEFRNCSAAQNGGIASVLESSIVSGGALKFSLGAARVTGGGVWASGVSSLSGAIISGCTSYGGGGVAAAHGAALALRGVNVSGCTAVAGGGGLAIDPEAHVIMSDAHIARCSAFFGAGIDAGARTVVTGEQTSIFECTAAHGAGINCDGCELYGLDVEFCTASVHGGGVSISGTNVVLNSVHVAFCSAGFLTASVSGSGATGGGLHLAETNAIFYEVHVTSCFAPAGAGVSVNASQLTLASGAKFSLRASNNGNSSTVRGGNLHILGSHVSVDGAVLMNGSAVHGGSAAIFGAPGAAITNSIIEGGVAIGGNAGGVEVSHSPGVVIMTSSIQYCEGLNAGGLWLNNSDVALPNTNISHNFAAKFGGGVVMMHGSSIFGPNALIYSNRAIISGGGIAVFVDGTISDGVSVRSSSALLHGGCVYLAEAAVAKLSDVAVLGCSAAASRGGVFMSASSKLVAVRFARFVCACTYYIDTLCVCTCVFVK